MCVCVCVLCIHFSIFSRPSLCGVLLILPPPADPIPDPFLTTYFLWPNSIFNGLTSFIMALHFFWSSAIRFQLSSISNSDTSPPPQYRSIASIVFSLLELLRKFFFSHVTRLTLQHILPKILYKVSQYSFFFFSELQVLGICLVRPHNLRPQFSWSSYISLSLG